MRRGNGLSRLRRPGEVLRPASLLLAVIVSGAALWHETGTDLVEGGQRLVLRVAAQAVTATADWLPAHPAAPPSSNAPGNVAAPAPRQITLPAAQATAEVLATPAADGLSALIGAMENAAATPDASVLNVVSESTAAAGPTEAAIVAVPEVQATPETPEVRPSAAVIANVQAQAPAQDRVQTQVQAQVPVAPPARVAAPPAPRPVTAAAPTPVSTSTAGTRTLVVAEGDTLYSIAERYGTTVKALVTLNKLDNPDKIAEGDRLTVPR